MKEEWKKFIDVFRNINKTFLNVILIDILFFALAYAGFTIWSNVIEGTSPAVQAGTTESIGSSIFTIVFSFMILLLYLVIIFSASQGTIWNLIFKKDLKKFSFKRFYIFNIIALPLYMILLYVFAQVFFAITDAVVVATSSVSSNTVFFAIIAVLYSVFIGGPLALYFFNILSIAYIDYVQHQKIKSALKAPFVFIFQKGYSLYVPYALLMVFVLVASLILQFFKLVPALYAYISILYVIFFLAFMRTYLKELVKL
jgi:hypothetical protein